MEFHSAIRRTVLSPFYGEEEGRAAIARRYLNGTGESVFYRHAWGLRFPEKKPEPLKDSPLIFFLDAITPGEVLAELIHSAHETASVVIGFTSCLRLPEELMRDGIISKIDRFYLAEPLADPSQHKPCMVVLE